MATMDTSGKLMVKGKLGIWKAKWFELQGNELRMYKKKGGDIQSTHDLTLLQIKEGAAANTNGLTKGAICPKSTGDIPGILIDDDNFGASRPNEQHGDHLGAAPRLSVGVAPNRLSMDAGSTAPTRHSTDLSGRGISAPPGSRSLGGANNKGEKASDKLTFQLNGPKMSQPLILRAEEKVEYDKWVSSLRQADTSLKRTLETDVNKKKQSPIASAKPGAGDAPAGPGSWPCPVCLKWNQRFASKCQFCTKNEGLLTPQTRTNTTMASPRSTVGAGL